MKNSTDRTVAAIALLCALCVVFSLFNRWILFGVTAWMVITLEFAFGLGRASSHRAAQSFLALVFLSYIVLFLGMHWLHDPSGEPIIVLGYPVGTALLIYGIWPLGMVPSLLYAAIFDRWILPPDRLERFLDEFGRQEDSA